MTELTGWMWSVLWSERQTKPECGWVWWEWMRRWWSKRWLCPPGNEIGMSGWQLWGEKVGQQGEVLGGNLGRVLL